MTVPSNVQKSQDVLSPTHYDVIIVGAGPYGLSAAAHLQESGMNVAIFGKPLALWLESMPKGMMLRSEWWATNLSDPHARCTLERYFQKKEIQPSSPLTMETFIDYALWFQKQAVPNVDETFVKTIEKKDEGFIVTLVDDRVVQSSAVILAPGLSYYKYRPAEYDSFSPDLVSHAADHISFDRFIDKQVIVIGGGQSALETSALVQECGAHVQLVTRHPIVWLAGLGTSIPLSPLHMLRHPKAGIGYSWFSWGLEHFPYAFWRLSRTAKNKLLLGRGRYGPAGAPWLKPRIDGKISIHQQHVQSMKELDDGVSLSLSDNTTLKADHVILATGYRVDTKKLKMLHSSLLSKIQTYQNAPILNDQFESSIPGLYFIGISSVASFGPLYRFVIGTEAAARRVSKAVVRKVRLAK